MNHDAATVEAPPVLSAMEQAWAEHQATFEAMSPKAIFYQGWIARGFCELDRMADATDGKLSEL